MDDQDWMNEFNLPNIPYADDFVERSEIKIKLQALNIEDFTFCQKKTVSRVTFDPIIVKFYYK